MKLRKVVAVGSILTAGVALAACNNSNNSNNNNNNTSDNAASYSDYMAAMAGTEQTICGYITDRCTWYNNAASFYLQDDNGGYYVYNLRCTEEEYATLTVGKKLHVTGKKSEWKGQTEIDYTSATENQEWKLEDGTKTYAATSVANIATASLDAYVNTKVSLTNLTVTSSAFTSWNDYSLVTGAGADVYFSVADSLGNTLSFVVESYLEDTQYGSACYTAAAGLKAGDVIDLEGFVYYYNAPQLQCTKITVKTASAATPFADYMAAESGSEVTAVAAISDRCTWYNNAASFYLQDGNHGYYVYNLACTEEEYAKLVPGTLIQVTGAKGEWKGELEIDYGKATENQDWKILPGKVSNPIIKVTDIATTTLDLYKNCYVSVDAELEVTKAAFNNWTDYTLTTGAGKDVYFTVKDAAGNELTFVVEAYLEDTQYGSELYTTVAGLNVGDKVKLAGYVYYYNVPQMQVSSCTKVTA